MTAISCKHLLHLSRKLYPKEVTKKFEMDLEKYFQGEEFAGISQQTLFRHYEEKISLAVKVTNYLYQFEEANDLSLAQEEEEWVFKAVVRRLRRERNEENCERVEAIMEMLGSGGKEVLRMMGDSEYVRCAQGESRQNISRLTECLAFLFANQRKSSFLLITETANAGHSHIRKIREVEAGHNNHVTSVSPRHRKKTEFVSTLVLNNKKELVRGSPHQKEHADRHKSVLDGDIHEHKQSLMSRQMNLAA